MEPLMLMGFPSDKIYLVEQTNSYYAFLYMGNETMGMREKQITDYPETLTDACISMAGKKDLWIEKRSVTSCALTMKQNVSTPMPNCGTLKMKTADGKKRTFIILNTHPAQELRQFFPATEEVKISKSSQHQAAREAYGKELARNRNEEDIKKYRILYWAMLALSVPASIVPMLLGMYLDYILAINLLVAAISLLLVFLKPQWFCLNENNRSNTYGIPMFSVIFPLFVSLAFLSIATLEAVDYISWGRYFLINGILSLILGSALWYFAPERKADPVGLLPTLFLILLFGWGIGGTINLLDINQGYDWSEFSTVTDLEVSHSSKGGTSYNVISTTADGEMSHRVSKDYFNTLQVGDTVTVDHYEGTLGIPFCWIVEYYDE